MSPTQISEQLSRISASNDFEADSANLTDNWFAAAVGAEATEPILRFMEQNPNIDFGAPGALVHFVERVCGPEYEDRLIESVDRLPTAQTVWMLNRAINGARSPAEKERLTAALRRARMNPAADDRTLWLAAECLKHISQ